MEVVNIYIIGRCANQLNGDDDELCNQLLHIHLKPNRTYVKKIRNRCVHIGKVDGGRVRDLEGIVFETDKKKKKRVNKNGGEK